MFMLWVSFWRCDEASSQQIPVVLYIGEYTGDGNSNDNFK
jgi:hypothetical protein